MTKRKQRKTDIFIQTKCKVDERDIEDYTDKKTGQLMRKIKTTWICNLMRKEVLLILLTRSILENLIKETMIEIVSEMPKSKSHVKNQ